VVVVDSHREDLLGPLLPDHIIVKNLADILGCRHAVARLDEAGLRLLTDDVHAQLDAFIADEHRRPGNQFADLVLALAAERAVERVLRLAAADFGHPIVPTRLPAVTRRSRPSARPVPRK